MSSMTSASELAMTSERASAPKYGPMLVNILRWTIIILVLLFTLFPVVWIISASFNPSGSMVTQTLIPTNVKNLDDLFINFRKLLNDPQVPFWRWIGNSALISVTSTVLSLAITTVSAYAFSRFRFRGRRTLLQTVLLIQVFPNLLAMVALYLMLVQIGKYIPFFAIDTYGGLILIYLGGAMGLNTWLMKGYYDTIPRDIDESAVVDGATHWQTFRYLIFPLIRPILAVVGLLAFVGTFNEFLLARIVLQDRNNWTLMVGLFNFVNSKFTDLWGVFAAGSLISATPVVILYLSLQKYIVGGLTVGAVKG